MLHHGVACTLAHLGKLVSLRRVVEGSKPDAGTRHVFRMIMPFYNDVQSLQTVLALGLLCHLNVHVPNGQRLRHRLRLSSYVCHHQAFNANIHHFSMATPRNSLRGFLTHAKNALRSAINSNQKVTLVIGNESAGQHHSGITKVTGTDWN